MKNCNSANGCGCFAQVRGYGAVAPSESVEVLPDVWFAASPYARRKCAA